MIERRGSGSSAAAGILRKIPLALFLLASYAAYEPACPDWFSEVFHLRGSRSPASILAAPLPPLLLHSHNDFEQKHPLYDALESHMTSVEADLWFKDGVIKVSHSGWDRVGTLEELYLDPLQKIVSSRGSVYGDGKPFYLWIDIKYGYGDGNFAESIHRILERYSMLTVIDHGRVLHKGPVNIILTGNPRVGRELIARFPVRKATRDAGRFSPDDPAADADWQWYALKWADYFEWDGESPLPQAERAKFRALVDAIHAKGRSVRFWDTPDTEDFWKECADAGVDMIGTGKLARLSRFARAEK